jgi:hypothetical protein
VRFASGGIFLSLAEATPVVVVELDDSPGSSSVVGGALFVAGVSSKERAALVSLPEEPRRVEADDSTFPLREGAIELVRSSSRDFADFFPPRLEAPPRVEADSEPWSEAACAAALKDLSEDFLLSCLDADATPLLSNGWEVSGGSKPRWGLADARALLSGPPATLGRDVALLDERVLCSRIDALRVPVFSLPWPFAVGVRFASFRCVGSA